MTLLSRLDTVFDLLATAGARQYGQEPVSQLQHALQAAAMAEAAGATPALITAALLHDIGHLTDPDFETALDRGEDRWHEDLGADHLADLFGPEVTEPVRLHVPAKRYLCAVDPAYAATLSPTSRKTLALQGGAFDRDAACAFIARPHGREAIQVRRWDDRAKIPHLATPDLAHFRAHALAACSR
ncbi:MAG: HD domain-containing protein [Alphaproteobacteria bacterium]|nr:HD domain-containing protein [Alphaproteobacteria bacterium]MCB9930820.1 HD domain-containing protein [Alphaproteobacteria bacterium]